eukprot:CAMPEP_0169456616 /NCGR_PEP_ID=MMETSP1042-20121227/16445_1 /TAXON_ID=464988 /ORGANISM="Hemiselmis andersenii, Strain CCMP1180" /LENGTH=230 /DNA_ID=CAMNT_0009568845 /DNA_START=164 /DNA_END=853 /DNA_ORIENTATION=-
MAEPTKCYFCCLPEHQRLEVDERVHGDNAPPDLGKFWHLDVCVEGKEGCHQDVMCHKQCLMLNRGVIDNGKAETGYFCDRDIMRCAFADLHQCCVCGEDRAGTTVALEDDKDHKQRYWFHVPCAVKAKAYFLKRNDVTEIVLMSKFVPSFPSAPSPCPEPRPASPMELDDGQRCHEWGGAEVEGSTRHPSKDATEASGAYCTEKAKPVSRDDDGDDDVTIVREECGADAS